MKTIDRMLELTNNNDDVVSETMLIVEDMIYSEILDIDAITKWYEIEQATKEKRSINFIEYEPTEVPQMIINDLNFDKAVKRKVKQITNLFFEEMESETFNKWVFDLDILINQAKREIA